MGPIAKFLILGGAILIGVGLFWEFAGRRLGLGRLPGDIVIQREHFKFYLPIATCLLLSVVLSLLAWLIGLFLRK